MFTDGYIAAIRDLGLARFRFVLYTLSDGNREGSRHTFYFGVEIITNLTIVFVSLYFKVPQRYESRAMIVYSDSDSDHE